MANLDLPPVREVVKVLDEDLLGQLEVGEDKEGCPEEEVPDEALVLVP